MGVGVLGWCSERVLLVLPIRVAVLLPSSLLTSIAYPCVFNITIITALTGILAERA